MAVKLKLTTKRKQVLQCLAQFHAADREPDHHRIAVLCGKEYSDADWAHGPLRDLLKVGYVEVAGNKFQGGRLWRITDAGRAALRRGCREA